MRILNSAENLPSALTGGVVAIGNFDGVHRGHRVVIGEAGHIARSNDLAWLVLTFEPHPRSVFAPDSPPFRLTPGPAKARWIAELGVDALVALPFDRAFSERQAEDFIHDILVTRLRSRHVVSGYDFKFGHGRRGNGEMMLRKGAELGFAYTAVSAEADESGTTISSSRIRDLLRAGEVREAAAVLGHEHEIEGVVQTGDARGRTIGFPTANVALGDHLRPARGVYAVRAAVVDTVTGATDGPRRDGVANFGSRPTFDGTDELLEVHLFDYDGDLYGKALRITLVDFLRAERKFDGIDDLKRQITADAAQARDLLAAAGRDRPGSSVVPINKHRALS